MPRHDGKLAHCARAAHRSHLLPAQSHSRAKGIHTLRLEVEETREELAATLNGLFAALNLRVQMRSHPVVFAGALLALVCAAVALLVRSRAHGR